MSLFSKMCSMPIEIHLNYSKILFVFYPPNDTERGN